MQPYLGTPEIDDHDVDKGQADEDDVVLPLDVRKGSRGGLDVHQR
jgi:hypothetical protein